MTSLESHQVYLPAEAASSSAARALVATAARQVVCMTEPDIDDLCVAVGEAFANVVRHGSDQGEDPVHLRVERLGDRLLVHFFYRSDPFNTSPEPPAPDDLAGGGYGLFIMRTLADVVEFEFENGSTHLCLEKRCSALKSSTAPEPGVWEHVDTTLSACSSR